ncbi:MAG: hypothetical protein SFX73_29985 [Kofleriaceae bacterium]|nr:hypothetical protein [Kofleriaceae bacterium]
MEAGSVNFITRVVVATVGAGTGAIGIMRGPSLVGAVAWTVAVAIACYGYGVVVERLTRARVSTPFTIVAGLALLLVVSTVLARTDMLGRTTQLVLLAGGLPAYALPRHEDEATRPPWGLVAFSVAAAVLMVVIAIVHEITPTAGGTNHVFAIKRLWDTGSFGILRQELGFGLVGESYAAWATGAQIASVFDLAWCPALLVGLLAYALPARDRTVGGIAFVVIAIPIAIYPDITTEWAGTLLACAAFFTLQSALETGRTSWHTLLFALALCTSRNEYLVVGSIYAVAALVLPRVSTVSRRALVGWCSGWVGALVGFQLIVKLPVALALIKALELLLVVPVVAFVIYLLGVAWRSALAVHWFATLTFGFGLVLGAVRETQHAPDATVAMWVALAICSLTIITHAPSPRVFSGAAAFVLAIVMSARAFDPAFNGERWGIGMRYAKALLWIQEQIALGCMTWVHEDVRAMQEQVPAGEKLLFWGRSAALLDFARNQIRDVSWLDAKRWRPTDFLARLTPARLQGASYLIVEELEPSTPLLDMWTTSYVPTTASVQGRLVELGRAGLVRVYKIE